jgi:alkyl hydroperoxide reductase subunit AhpC
VRGITPRELFRFFVSYQLMKALPTVATPEYFQLEKAVEDRIPETTFGIPNIDRVAFRATDVFDTGIFGIHDGNYSLAEKRRNERGRTRRDPRFPAVVGLVQTTRGDQSLEANLSLRINDTAPDFTAETTQGTIKFHEWIDKGWAILFSHPKDFTPVCTTELGYMARLEPEFKKRNTKIIGLSVDPVASHGKWKSDIEETQNCTVNYPMIGDPELKIAKLYDMLPATAGDTSEGRTPANNATVRTVFIIGPDKQIKTMLIYPMTTGRNFDEVLRILDSLQLTAKHRVATPVNWKEGDDVIIVPAVSDDEAKKIYPAGWKTLRPYLRIVAQPK